MPNIDLEAAVRAGVITQAQADTLAQNAIDERDSTAHNLPEHTAEEADEGQEEPLKFIRNFGDIFLAIGLAMITFTLLAMNMTGSAFFSVVSLALYIGLSEWLVKKRKLVLPGMVILVSIVFFLTHLITTNSLLTSIGDVTSGALSGEIRWRIVMTFMLNAVAGGLYFWRYRLPFSVMVAVFFLVLAALTLFEPTNIPMAIWIAGLIIFILAMVYDGQDPLRRSYLSDVGFWLHLLAAPMLTHSFFWLQFEQASLFSSQTTVLSVAFFGFLMLLSLLVDRRAILLASITYCIFFLVGPFSGVDLSILNILLIIGVMVVLMGGFWYQMRNGIFGWLQGTRLARYLPPFDAHQ